MLVCTTDHCGNLNAGIRHPLLEVPIGTFTGWNIRRRGYGEPELASAIGSMLMLATTAGERVSSGDERPSFEELHGTHDEFVAKVEVICGKRVAERLFLEEDADQFIKGARAGQDLPQATL